MKELKEILPSRTEKSISNKLQRMGIKKTADVIQKKCNLARQSVNTDNFHLLKNFSGWSDLDEIQTQIFIGTLLGDGWITLCKKCNKEWSHHFCLSHGIKQKDYLLWKTSFLSPLKPKTHSLEIKPTMQTPNHPFFYKLREEMYVNGKKRIIPNELCEKIDLLGFLIWYLDDGCYSNGKPVISSSLFAKEALQKMADKINSKYNTNLYVTGKKYKQIYFSKQTKEKIFPMFVELADKLKIPQCMYYKFGI